MSLKPINLNLAAKFADPEYFHEYFGERAQDDVANGIRELREVRGMKQGDLAVAAEMKQSAVSRIEGADYSGWTFNSLRRIARALDARLSIAFEPRQSVIATYQTRALLSGGFREVIVPSGTAETQRTHVFRGTSTENFIKPVETSNG